MSKVPSFIIEQLKDKITQRYVVNSEDFFFIIEGMGIIDNEELLFEIFEYLENAKIDVHFKTGTEQLRYQMFKKIEERVSLMRRLNATPDRVRNLNNIVDKIKPNINDKWLKSYMLDSDEDRNKYLTELNITHQTTDLDSLKERIISQEVNRRNEEN
jgi:hypothetical protein